MCAAEQKDSEREWITLPEQRDRVAAYRTNTYRVAAAWAAPGDVPARDHVLAIVSPAKKLLPAQLHAS